MDAAPEAGEPPKSSESAETAEETTKPRARFWRRVKIPTGVVVTLVGIALTAWLLPAVTRQWDDRQKAREVKASVAADTASMTARALLRATPTGTPPEVVEGTLLSAWQIESRLRLYFPPSITGAWELYSFALALIIDAPYIQTQTAYGRAVTTGRFATRHVALRAATMLAAAESFYSESESDSDSDSGTPSALKRQWAKWIASGLESAHPGVSKEAEQFNSSGGFLEFAHDVEELQAAIATELVSAHLTGYSTTTHDLIDDLLPF